jgi:hypothetical protein
MTTTTTITFDALAREVIRFVEESPNYVYPGDASSGCTYTDMGVTSPACLWGRAMLNLGVAHSLLYQESTFINSLLPRLGIEATARQIEWAWDVQRMQDQRLSWGRAVAIAGPCPFTDAA